MTTEPPEKELISGSVWIDRRGEPFAIARGWVHWWHPDKQWVTLREALFIEPLLSCERVSPEHAKLYGIKDDGLGLAERQAARDAGE